MARTAAAEQAFVFLTRAGLWRTLSDSGIEPDLENSINQWQELFQKKYVSEQPVYSFERRFDNTWYCRLDCETVFGWGIAKSKVAAKKRAAFMALVHLFSEAGIKKQEWRDLVNQHSGEITKF